MISPCLLRSSGPALTPICSGWTARTARSGSAHSTTTDGAAESCSTPSHPPEDAAGPVASASHKTPTITETSALERHDLRMKLRVHVLCKLLHVHKCFHHNRQSINLMCKRMREALCSVNGFSDYNRGFSDECRTEVIDSSSDSLPVHILCISGKDTEDGCDVFRYDTVTSESLVLVCPKRVT